MKNDYLWDRTGSDPETERLESMLEGLKFRPAEPPAAPAREIVLAPARGNWLLRFGLGFAAASAACVALIVGLSAIRETPQPVIVAEESPAAVGKPEALPAPPAQPEYVKASYAPKRKPKPRPRKRTRPDAKFTPLPVEPRPLPETLTAEERDAYRQLMTALAITGENLNIVREKLNGTQ